MSALYTTMPGSPARFFLDTNMAAALEAGCRTLHRRGAKAVSPPRSTSAAALLRIITRRYCHDISDYYCEISCLMPTGSRLIFASHHLAPLLPDKRSQIGRATKIVELHLGFRVEIGGQQELAPDHVGGKKRAGLRQYDEVYPAGVQQDLELLHDVDPVLCRESAATQRLDANVYIRLRMYCGDRVTGNARRDLFRPAPEHVDREQPVLSGERCESALKIIVHVLSMTRSVYLTASSFRAHGYTH